MLATRFASLALIVALVPTAVQAAPIDPLTPTDSDFYLTANVKQILNSPLLEKKVVPALRDLIANSQEASDVLKELNFDPLKDLDRVTVAGPGGKAADRGLIIVSGTFDVKKFEKRAAEAAENNSEALKINKVPLGGGVMHEVYEVSLPNVDQTLYVALANNKTMLISPGKDYVVDALKASRLQKKTTLKNKAFAAVLEKMDARQTVMVAAAGKALQDMADCDCMPKLAQDAVAKVEALAGGLTVSREIKLELAISTKEEDNAEVVRRSASKGVALALAGLGLLTEERKELNLLVEVLKTVKVAGKAKVVTVNARLTADVLDDFFKKDE